MNSTAFNEDLFAWAQPTPAAPSKQATAAPTAPQRKIRRAYPFVISGAPLGGTADLETLVVDGTKPEEKP